MKKRKAIDEAFPEPQPDPIEQVPVPVPTAPTVVIVNHPWTSDGAKAKGMRCPKCHCIQFSDGQNVRNTIRVENAIRRYRVCRNCGRTWTTIER